MSRKRGLNLQNALARFLRLEGWPKAESAGAGRPGTDVLNTPGVVWENKTADEWDVLEWVRQCRRHALAAVGCLCLPDDPRHPNPPDVCHCDCHHDPAIPITVYWPRGVGEQSVESTLSIVPTGVMVRLLREAGYCDQ